MLLFNYKINVFEIAVIQALQMCIATTHLFLCKKNRAGATPTLPTIMYCNISLCLNFHLAFVETLDVVVLT